MLLIDDINTLWWGEFKLAAIDARVHLDTTEINRRGLSQTVIEYHHHRLTAVKAH